MSIASKTKLREAIRLQEIKLEASKELLIEQYRITKENLTPANLVKSTFSKMTENSHIGGKLLKAGMGIGAALVTSKLFASPSTSFARKALTVAMNLGLVNVIAKPIKKKGIQLLQRLRDNMNGTPR